MIPDCVVVGAGCAGLAAATRLAERGARVLVLEARRTAGGRSRSWIDAATGDVEDNGQHLVMGCYREFLAFARRTGGIDEIRFQERPRVVLVEEGGARVTFAPGPLPRPFDLPWALLRMRGFPARSIAAASGLLRDLRRGVGDDAASASTWLERHGQGIEARRRFWDPLILATLNMHASQAPAGLLAEVLRRALLGGRDAARLGFARHGLSSLVVDPAVRFLRERSCEMRTGRPVARIECDAGGRLAAVTLRDGTRVPAGAAVLAVPHREAAAIAGRDAGSWTAAAAERLGASPIVAIHLWLDQPVCDEAAVGLIDSPVHWVFNRARIGGAAEPGYLALVSSAAVDLARQPRERLAKMARDELERFFPAEAAGAVVRRFRVLKERRATPAFVPGNVGLRPGPETGVRNLFLAGDWTDTGLPATLEGAAASGHAAADALTASGRRRGAV